MSKSIALVSKFKHTFEHIAMVIKIIIIYCIKYLNLLDALIVYRLLR